MDKLPRMSFYWHLFESLFHDSFLFHACIFFFIRSFGVAVCVCGGLGFFLEQCLPNELQGPELTFLSFPYLWWQDQLKLHLLDLSRTCLAPLSDRSSPWEHSDLQPGAVNELRSRQVSHKWSDLMYIFLTLHCLPRSASCAGKLLRELRVSYHSLTFWVK